MTMPATTPFRLTTPRKFAGLHGKIARSALVLALALAAAGCGKGDMDENFRLWSNNSAGWDEMSNFVADKENPIDQRVRAVEILVDDGGQPSQVGRVVNKASDKTEILTALVPKMEKLLQGSNTKKQAHAKKVLFDMLEDTGLADDKKVAIRQTIGKWAFGDLDAGMPADVVKEKLGQRVNPAEIEKLGPEAIKGAEIMLAKGISRGEVMAFLNGLEAPEAKVALINGLRTYHKIKNVKVTEVELTAVQNTKSVDGFLYFLELYFARKDSAHPDDKAAATLALGAALSFADLTENPTAKKTIGDAWERVKPVAEQLLAIDQVDYRFFGAQLFANFGGADGVATVLAKIPDDTKYGDGDFAKSDSKLRITSWCTDEVKPAVPADQLRPVLEKAWKSSPRLIERVLALRCLVALGDDASLAIIKAATPADPVLAKDVQPLVVTPAPLALSALGAASVAVIEYQRSVDKLLAEGKIDADTAKYRKEYAGYSFQRSGKELAAFAEEQANDKIARLKAKAAK
jgi:hypothetical protein